MYGAAAQRARRAACGRQPGSCASLQAPVASLHEDEGLPSPVRRPPPYELQHEPAPPAGHRLTAAVPQQPRVLGWAVPGGSLSLSARLGLCPGRWAAPSPRLLSRNPAAKSCCSQRRHRRRHLPQRRQRPYRAARCWSHRCLSVLRGCHPPVVVVVVAQSHHHRRSLRGRSRPERCARPSKVCQRSRRCTSTSEKSAVTTASGR
jgi:hypothetical protein